MKLQTRMTNAVTKQLEYFDDILPPDDRIHEFLPQNAVTLGMFKCLIDLGHTPRYAYCRTLDACTPGSPSLLEAMIEAGQL